MKGYDNIPENENILLDLPFYEGTGIITRDQGKPHHQNVSLNDPGGGSFVWTVLASGLMVLEFVTVGGGVDDGVYLDLPAADCADLNFTAGDFSVGVWIKWDSTFGLSEIIIGRYGALLDGWELYLDISSGRNTVSQRHNHSSIAGNDNSNCFSVGWTPGVWAFLGVSRTGGNLYPQHYRNGVPLLMSYEITGMLDPDTCNRDLVIGCRYSKNANWYKGQMWRPRVWNRVVTAAEWLIMFNKERAWFGV